MSHISWKALNICKEENNYAISWISNECQLFKKYELKLIFADSLSASFAQLVWRWSPEKMSRVRISVKSNFSSSLWDGARYHERPKFCWGPAMPSIYGQNCGLKTWALSWHHLHRENAKEFLNDRIYGHKIRLWSACKVENDTILSELHFCLSYPVLPFHLIVPKHFPEKTHLGAVAIRAICFTENYRIGKANWKWHGRFHPRFPSDLKNGFSKERKIFSFVILAL